MGNFIVAGILAVIVVLIVRYLIKQKRSGHGCCGGSCKTCGHCPQSENSAGSCDCFRKDKP